MARVCDICAKRSDFGNNRPFSLKATRRQRKVNLQWYKLELGGNKYRFKICSSCRRTMVKKDRLPKELQGLIK